MLTQASNSKNRVSLDADSFQHVETAHGPKDPLMMEIRQLEKTMEKHNSRKKHSSKMSVFGKEKQAHDIHVTPNQLSKKNSPKIQISNNNNTQMGAPVGTSKLSGDVSPTSMEMSPWQNNVATNGQESPSINHQSERSKMSPMGRQNDSFMKSAKV